MLNINCSQTIASIVPILNACPFEVPKSGKLLFRKRTGATSLLIATSGSGSVALSATWTGVLTASDETKALVASKVTGINVPAIDLPKVDSGSANGVQRVRTVVPATSLTGRMFGADPAFVKEFRKLANFSYAYTGPTNLEVFIFDEKNNIFCLKNDTAATGIPIYNLEVTSLSIEDAEDFSNYVIRFDLPHGWDDNLTKVACSFDIMSVLVNDEP